MQTLEYLIFCIDISQIDFKCSHATTLHWKRNLIDKYKNNYLVTKIVKINKSKK